MRLAGLFAAKNGFDESDITGVTIDVVVGLFAGLALIVGVWLLGSVVNADTVHVASALAG
ncbi:hypothetical protein ACMDCR_22395 [Labrys okinawensis]|uniref:hypothetical protein n=1 Tax=Labrys okinawensis TaxID=346911 RepID=UPI0039BCDF25